MRADTRDNNLRVAWASQHVELTCSPMVEVVLRLWAPRSLLQAKSSRNRHSGRAELVPKVNVVGSSHTLLSIGGGAHGTSFGGCCARHRCSAHSWSRRGYGGCCCARIVPPYSAARMRHASSITSMPSQTSACVHSPLGIQHKRHLAAAICDLVLAFLKI
eukprot:4656539-Amphidinium_carterae.1